MTTENIQINIREDGAKVVQRNIEDIGKSATTSATNVEALNNTLKSQSGHQSVANLKEAMEQLTFSTTGARRELLVLAHELSQGQYKRFAGSLLVLAEYTNAASLMFSAAGVAVLGFTAALVGMAIAMAKGAAEQKAMNDALILTGGIVGKTSDQLYAMAQNASKVHGTIGQAKDAVILLAQSGKFSGDQIGYITEAVVALEHATGRSIEETIKEFEKLAVQATSHSMTSSHAISDATVKLDESYNFLTLSVYNQIRALEREGEVKEASRLATLELAKVTKERADQIIEDLGYIASGWHSVKSAISGAIDEVGKWGQKSTPAKRVAELTAEIKKLEDAAGEIPPLFESLRQQKLSAALDDLAKAQKELNAQNASADEQRRRALAQSEAVHAAQRVDNILMVAAKRSAGELAVALGEYRSELEKIRKVNANDPRLTPEAIKEGEAAITRAHTLNIREQKSAYEGLMKSIQDKIAVNREQLASDDKLTEGQKMAARFTKEVADGTIKLVATKNMTIEQQKRFITLALEELIVLEQQNSIKEANTKANEKLLEQGDKELETLQKQLKTQNEHNEQIGKTKAQVDLLKAARMEDAAAADEQLAANLMLAADFAGPSADAYRAYANTLQNIVKTRREIAESFRKGAGLEQQKADFDAAEKASKKLSDMAIRDWQNLGNTIAESLSDGFGRGGKAIGQMFKAYATGISQQLRLTKELELAKKLADTDPTKIRIINDLQSAMAQNQLRSYGEMADAARDFFTEGSRGYAAMAAAAQVLHTAEVALSLIKGVNAVLTQGEDDPYSAFARMAAMAAIVTGLGVAIGGSFGGKSTQSADLQAAAGTGSVFGDTKAKSDSIARSLEIVSKNSNVQLAYTADMVKSLHTIASGIGGLTSLIVRTTGISGQTAADTRTLDKTGVLLGAGPITWLLSNIPVVGNLLSKLFGTTTSVVDQGINILSTTLREIETSGLSAQSYVTTESVRKFLGITIGTSTSTQTSALSEEITRQFGMIITNIGDTIKQAAGILGISGDEFDNQLKSFVIDIGNISVKGLTGEQIQKQFENVFSKLGDDMAKFAVSGLDAFQKVGEGYFETLTRIANDYATLDTLLATMGRTFGQVGVASIAARERLIEATGGLDKFTDQVTYYVANFTTDEQKLSAASDLINRAFGNLHTAMPKTIEEFNALVHGLDFTTEAGANQLAMLMQIAPAFKDFIDLTNAATKEAAEKAAEIADKRQALQIDLLKAQGRELDAVAIQRQAEIAALEKLDPSLANLQREIYRTEDAAAAAEKALDRLNKQRSLDIELMEALGLSSQALAAKRADELAGLDAMHRATQQAIYDAEDRNKALESTFNAAKKSIDAAKAEAKANFDAQTAIIEAQKAASQTTFEEFEKANKAAQDTAKSISDALADLSSGLKNAIDTILGASEFGLTQSQASAELQRVLNVAKATGELPTAESLRNVLSSITQFDTSSFGSAEEMKRAQGLTLNQLSDLNGITEDQKSVADKQLDTLTDQYNLAKAAYDLQQKGYDSQKEAARKAYDQQIANYDRTLDLIQQQYDILRGTYVVVSSVTDAVNNFNTAANAVLAAAAAKSPSVSGVTPPLGINPGAWGPFQTTTGSPAPTIPGTIAGIIIPTTSNPMEWGPFFTQDQSSTAVDSATHTATNIVAAIQALQGSVDALLGPTQQTADNIDGVTAGGTVMLTEQA